ncbi:hypothetical protein [Methanoplanus endosymbiosus]|uniref:Uncharacterized protein n=1 Tax=Methanoplanus endosymbiosus TaxID=33865 RepID=A0A9E7TJD3_9EURY|nr:hypothetical protein [Methanoplanus endosymbiosus]UUX91620.1 hypothetical protein L6E24_09580 [Methanoplanus endosymbiosus]
MEIIRNPDGSGGIKFTIDDLLEPLPVIAHSSIKRNKIEILCPICGCIHTFNRKESIVILPCNPLFRLEITGITSGQMPPELKKIGAGNARRKAEAEAAGQTHHPEWKA